MFGPLVPTKKFALVKLRAIPHKVNIHLLLDLLPPYHNFVLFIYLFFLFLFFFFVFCKLDLLGMRGSKYSLTRWPGQQINKCGKRL